MTRQELFELTDSYSPMDEVIILSPGGKEMSIKGLNDDAIHRTGKICLDTLWIEKIREDGLVAPKEPKPKKTRKKRAKNRTKATVVRTGQRGRPRRLRDEDDNKVE